MKLEEIDIGYNGALTAIIRYIFVIDKPSIILYWTSMSDKHKAEDLAIRQ